jgi:Flp pilus assembly protein TadG
VRSPLRAEGGSITAEFAAVVPAVMLVLAAALVALQLGTQQLRLHDAAAVTARALARGDTPPTYEGAARTTTQRGDLLCARLSLAPRPPFFVALEAESCALAS